MAKFNRVLAVWGACALVAALSSAQDLMNDDTVYAIVGNVYGADDWADYRSPSSWIDIKWELAAPGGKKLTIDLLYKNMTFVRKIGSSLPKVLQYKWVLPNNIDTDQYRIRVGYPDNSTSVSDSFTIKADPFADPTKLATISAITQPQSSQRVPGDQVIVMWTVGTPGGMKVNIDLVKSEETTNWLVTLVRQLATVAPNATSWYWTVPADLPTGKYAIRIGYPAINQVNYSPTFPVVTSVPAVTASSTSTSSSPTSASSASAQDSKPTSLTGAGAHATEGGVAFIWTLTVATAMMAVVAGGYIMQW